MDDNCTMYICLSAVWNSTVLLLFKKNNISSLYHIVCPSGNYNKAFIQQKILSFLF